MFVNKRGITLIALVITIVILIILSTIVINMAFGDNGLIKYAESASDYAANDEAATSGMLNSAVSYIDNLTNPETATTVADAKGGNLYKDTTAITDEIGNTVYIPGGFKVSSDSAIKVEDGIVIEDSEGNQFVWIPTGTYHTSRGDKANELTRWQWGTIVNVVQEPIPVIGDSVTNTYFYGEGDSRSVAHDTINNFLNSAKPVSEGGNGGFYIGRYEAGTEIERTASGDALTTPLVQANKYPYNYVTRDEAKAQAESMYSGKSEIKATSQLISSYAWDIALNFICQNSDYGYELATTTSSDRGNIGTNNKTQTGGYAEDCYSNIYDLLGNCYEWTTEYSSNADSSRSYPCVNRGGVYTDSRYYAARRYNLSIGPTGKDLSFRLSLYV